MAPEPVSERRNFRLKNRKLQPIRNEMAVCAGPKFTEERLEDMICSAFSLPVFFSLLPHELANLEATCRCFNEALNGENATLIWIASAYAASRAHRLLLPVQSFAGTFAGRPLAEIKYTLANMKYARGFLNGSPVPLSTGAEFDAVSSICVQAAAQKVASPNSATRVVAGRLKFRQEDMMGSVPMFTEEEDEGLDDADPDENKAYFSNDMTFCWTGQGSARKGTMLVASLGFLNGANVLEISSVIKPLKSPIALSVDVHLVSPLWPEGLKAEGIKVRVDGSCSGFDLPELDITDPDTKEFLTSPDGLLCILVFHNLPNVVTEVHARPVQAEALHTQITTTAMTQASNASSLNALSLSLPCISIPMRAPKCV
jgi:hypothetical protein